MWAHARNVVNSSACGVSYKYADWQCLHAQSVPARRTINIKPGLTTPRGPQHSLFGCTCFIRLNKCCILLVLLNSLERSFKHRGLASTRSIRSGLTVVWQSHLPIKFIAAALLESECERSFRTFFNPYLLKSKIGDVTLLPTLVGSSILIFISRKSLHRIKNFLETGN